ncbi:prohead core scaffolding protein and protease [uncultured Caudovirales phage]|uniref:Prohead core scaffolding protein and protease n=1 Tax=uncultured Caudovirales phage TaxID=2100421 RepID=A0A6J7WWY1_9CAUD|nr:prohead core scaffolding protein and protease [uncultured Caudovirales phage]
MKLITELNEQIKIITEEGVEGKKNLYIHGPFIQTEVKNRNGRMYRNESVSKEVKRYNEDYVLKGRALGELGHPEGPSINLDRVSHKIVSLTAEGNDFIGKAQILPTPMGEIARNLIESGVQLGVSTRGMGSLKDVGGVMEVQDDFYLATAGDIVADPSAPNAFVNGIMEGVEWVWDNGMLKAQQLEKARKHIEEAARKVTKSELEEAKLRVFNHFISNL